MQEFFGSSDSKHIVKTLSEMGVEIVQHQVNSSCLDVRASKQPIDEGDEVNLPRRSVTETIRLPPLGSTATNRLVVPLRTYS
jgi:predicted regulator of amino acid metabolism with ACT domain